MWLVLFGISGLLVTTTSNRLKAGKDYYKALSKSDEANETDSDTESSSEDD
jgi:hypothetical protein